MLPSNTSAGVCARHGCAIEVDCVCMKCADEHPLEMNEALMKRSEPTIKVTLNVQLTADPNQQTSSYITVPLSDLSKPEEMLDELLRPMMHAISDLRINMSPFRLPARLRELPDDHAY